MILAKDGMAAKDLAIGVFDSGMGGLTVLRALREQLPQESFIYLGDTARLPYGTKSSATVKHYAMQMARVLVEKRIKALVIACNTATSAALPYLQTMLPDMPVLGVIAPGANAAARMTHNRRIAVFATETTLASNVYQAHILEHLPDAKIMTRACSLLVALAEEGMMDNAIADATLRHYLEGLEDEDTLLLGCTHFPVFKAQLARILPANVSLVDSADATAMVLKTALIKKNLLTENTNLPHVHYLVTDSIKRFQAVGELFLGDVLAKEDVELIDA